ncbi:hypothetical protein Taro_014264 [Colocasia esculenta]|uniref:Uncharacterized protein n=1 Tax=Colocasia esculenta TaxID=4460 RepID=A0A843U8L0_COLES|nr:hypothetical protein [Colocasia esculenta]
MALRDLQQILMDLKVVFNLCTWSYSCIILGLPITAGGNRYCSVLFHISPKFIPRWFYLRAEHFHEVIQTTSVIKIWPVVSSTLEMSEPSKVIHVYNVEHEKNQALIQMHDVASAATALQYFTNLQPNIRGRNELTQIVNANVTARTAYPASYAANLWRRCLATNTQNITTGTTTSDIVTRSDLASGPNINLPPRINLWK